MNVKSWSRVCNIVESFKVAIDFKVARFAENLLQDFFEDFKSMGIIRQTEFARTEKEII